MATNACCVRTMHVQQEQHYISVIAIYTCTTSAWVEETCKDSIETDEYHTYAPGITQRQPSHRKLGFDEEKSVYVDSTKTYF